MEKVTYLIEIMKHRKGAEPLSRKGKVTILPTSETYVQQLFGKAGWVVTSMVPISQ